MPTDNTELTVEKLTEIETRNTGPHVVSLTIAERDALCSTVRHLLSENKRLLKLYNSAWLYVQQRVKHPNTGMPPAAMTLMEMLPLLPDSMHSLCVEKVKAALADARRSWSASRATTEYELGGRAAFTAALSALESLSIQGQ